MRDLQASLLSTHRQNAEGMVKTTEDVARYRQIIRDVQPALILEVGTFSGKSAVWFARTARCPVITCDVNLGNVSAETRTAGETAGVDFLLGRSTSPDVVSFMATRARATTGPVMVVLDGDHSGDTVHDEMVEYGPLVTVGSYMVVEDTLVRWMPWERQPQGPYRGSPHDAVDRWLASYPARWRNDIDLEDMADVTNFPGGWLRRTR